MWGGGYALIKESIVLWLHQQPERNDTGLTDYKIHCFHGEPKVVLVCRDRYGAEGLTEDFFTPKWKHLNVRREEHGNSKLSIDKPNSLEMMVELSMRLAKEIPFVRVDFYDINGKPYVGEMTLYPAYGFRSFIPSSFDRKMGEWIRI